MTSYRFPFILATVLLVGAAATRVDAAPSHGAQPRIGQGWSPQTLRAWFTQAGAALDVVVKGAHHASEIDPSVAAKLPRCKRVARSGRGDAPIGHTGGADVLPLESPFACFAAVRVVLAPYYASATMDCSLEVLGLAHVGDALGTIAADGNGIPIVDASSTFEVTSATASRVVVQSPNLRYDVTGDPANGTFVLERGKDGRWRLTGSDLGGRARCGTLVSGARDPSSAAAPRPAHAP